MRTLNRSMLVGLAISFVSTGAFAEQLYVGDKLVLNVYTEPEQAGGRVATIETGDAVEELERLSTFVRVRLADGREGWVGASYLTAQPPAIVRLKELLAGQTASAAPSPQVVEESARLKKQNAALTAEIAELKKKTTAPAGAAIKNAPSSAPAVHVATTPEEPMEREPVVVIQKSYWWAWLIAVVAAAGGGFVVGYQTLARRVRQRFGGVKVY